MARPDTTKPADNLGPSLKDSLEPFLGASRYNGRMRGYGFPMSSVIEGKLLDLLYVRINDILYDSLSANLKSETAFALLDSLKDHK